MIADRGNAVGKIGRVGVAHSIWIGSKSVATYPRGVVGYRVRSGTLPVTDLKEETRTWL